MRNILWILVLALFVVGCQQQSTPVVPMSQDNLLEQAVPVVLDDKPMLPAYKTLEELYPDKADSFGDYKDAHPEIYGINNPPSVGSRPVAEYEPAAKLMITYSSNSLPTGIKNNLVDVVKWGKTVVDIYVIYGSASAKTSFQNLLAGAGVSATGINWVNLQNDSVWIRDYGPVPIVSDSGKVGMVTSPVAGS